MFSEIDDEIILLSIDNSEYYNLNKIGSQIWLLLENETSFQALIKKLIQKFDVSEETCMQDTHSFLGESVMKGIIQIIDE